MEASKSMTRKLPWTHILCWAIFLLLFNVLPGYGDIAGFGLREWLLYAYNFAACVAVFYTAAHFAGKYIERHYIDFILEDSYRKRALLLMKRPVFAIVLLAGAYVGIGLLLENEVSGSGQGDKVLRVKAHISRAFQYVMVAVFYALVRWPGPQGGNGGGPQGDDGGEDGGPYTIRYKVVKPVPAKGERVA